MADLIFTQTVSALSLSTSALTIMQIVSPSNHRVRARRLRISFAGTVATNAPVKVLLNLQTTAGTASAGTPFCLNAVAETIQSTSQITFIVEPTSTSAYGTWYVHPETGIDIPITDIVMPGGTRMGLVCLAANAVTLSAQLILEE